MEVYGCPIDEPVIDYSNFDLNEMFRIEKEHAVKVKEHLISLGYTGKHTGKMYSTPIADGMAQYMYANKGAKGILIHLPYGDAWSCPNVQHLPKKVIVGRLQEFV